MNKSYQYIIISFALDGSYTTLKSGTNTWSIDDELNRLEGSGYTKFGIFEISNEPHELYKKIRRTYIDPTNDSANRIVKESKIPDENNKLYGNIIKMYVNSTTNLENRILFKGLETRIDELLKDMVNTSSKMKSL